MAKTIKLNSADFSTVCTQCSHASSSLAEPQLSLPQTGGNASALETYRKQANDLARLVGQYAEAIKTDAGVLKKVGNAIVKADKEAAGNFK